MQERPTPPARGPITADTLVVAAARLFRQRGYAATTTRQLSEVVGLQRASLYHHIRTKEDLLFEICVRSLNNIISAVRASVGDAAHPDRLPALIDTHLQLALQDQDMHATMLIELNQLSPTRRATIVAMRSEYETIIRDEIRAGQKARRLRQDLSARHLTLALLNLLNWTIFWYQEDSAETPRELAQMLTTLYLHGAAAAGVDS